MAKLKICFWQRMVTPHMAYLAEALSRHGHQVTYIAEVSLAEDRADLGWQLPDLEGVELHYATNTKEAKAMVAGAAPETVHLTQGLRSNGNVASAQNIIRSSGQRHFVLMETVCERGILGFVKPVLYQLLLRRWGHDLEGILAIGVETPRWLGRIAPKHLKIFPFAYFLDEKDDLPPNTDASRFRFIFVGALIHRKRVDFLFHMLAVLSDNDFELEVVGDGPLRANLEVLAGQILPGRVSFSGVLPISDIPRHMASADCLVLPSSHDGWGAVVSEALMAGTPVICSAACGSRNVVHASGVGGVFDTFDKISLKP